jgi:HAD superfamily phosphatase (TIGR01668 family)
LSVTIPKFLSLLSWKIYTPTVVVGRIADITPDALRNLGISAIITDLDNTLVPWRRYNVADEVVTWLADLERAGIKICIASNTLHTGRLRHLAETMNIPFVDRVRKPFVGGFLRAMQLMESTARETAVVGDQIFTDVLCGNRLALTTILLRPPLAKEEFLSTRMLRNVERALIARLMRRGLWPSYIGGQKDEKV